MTKSGSSASCPEIENHVIGLLIGTGKPFVTCIRWGSILGWQNENLAFHTALFMPLG